MAVVNTWSVVQLDCYPEYEGNTDVVFTVHWSATAQDGEFSGYTYGSSSMTLDPEATFVPFADLTEEQVIGWVQESLAGCKSRWAKMLLLQLKQTSQLRSRMPRIRQLSIHLYLGADDENPHTIESFGG